MKFMPHSKTSTCRKCRGSRIVRDPKTLRLITCPYCTRKENQE